MSRRGMLLVEAAGGKFTMTPRVDHPDKISVRASSGLIELDHQMTLSGIGYDVHGFVTDRPLRPRRR